MDSNYKTLWLSATELSALWSALQELKDVTHGKNVLKNVYEEMGVATVRAKWFTPDLARLAVSLGNDETAIPLKLSADDLKILGSLPLNSNLKEVLS